MARLRHDIIIAAAPREWFATFVAELHNALERAPFEHGWLAGDLGAEFPVALVDGRHLTPGARYRFGADTGADGVDGAGARSGRRAPLEAVVNSWDRATRSHVTVNGRTDTNRYTCGIELRSVDRPATFRVTARLSGLGDNTAPEPGRPAATRGWPTQRPVHCEVGVDFDHWWADTTGSGRDRPAEPPVSATISHLLVTARMAITVRPATAGSWEVSVRTTITGRSWTRPFAALGLLVGRRRLARGYRETVDAAARAWNTEVPKLISRDLAGPSGASIWELLTSLELEPSDRPSR